MRTGRFILWDMRFLAKYGFVFLYAFLTALYVLILYALPQAWRENTAILLIFADPAAMGLFFMGAIVLLEKSQRLPFAFAVSPVMPSEYILSKLCSLGALSLAVAALLALAAGLRSLRLILLGTAAASVISTLLGLIAAASISTLNRFILYTVPLEAVTLVPAILHLFGVTPAWLGDYPVNVCIDMMRGRVPSMAGCFMLAAVIAALFCVARRCVLKMWKCAEG